MRGICILLVCAGCEQFFPLEVTPVLPQGSRCGTTAAALVDDFTTLDDVWFYSPMTGASITFDGNANYDSAVGGAALLGKPLYDLRESSMEIELTVDQPPGLGGSFEFELRDPDVDMTGNGGNAIRFAVVGADPPATPSLRAEERVGLMTFTRADVPFDPTQPIRLRLSNSRNITTWSTAVGDAELATLHAAELDWNVAYMRPRLVTGNTGAGFAVHVGPIDGGAETCPADGLQDDFAVLDTDAWRVLNNINCQPAVVDGELVMDMSNATPGNLCTLGTSSIYNLLRHNFTVRTNGTNAINCVDALDVVTLDGRAASLRNVGGQLEVHEFTPQPAPSDRTRTGVAYQPDVHKYWRFTGLEVDGGEQLDISTSENGKTFEPLFSITDLSGLDRVQFQLGTSRDGGLPCTMVFDDANLLP